MNASVDPYSNIVDISGRDPNDDSDTLFHGCSLPETSIQGHRSLQTSISTSSHLAYITFWPGTINGPGEAFVIKYQASADGKIILISQVACIGIAANVDVN